MMVLDGQTALSAFRLERLNRDLTQSLPGTVAKGARYVYFIDADDADLNQAEVARVLRASNAPAQSATLWIVPRLGTISPWSSKATDILRGCGLAVRRVERGVAFDIERAPTPESPQWRRFTEALHDPMTQ